MDKRNNGPNRMADSPIDVRALIWVVNIILAVAVAVLTAWNESAFCLAWAAAAWIEYKVVQHLMKEEDNTLWK